MAKARKPTKKGVESSHHVSLLSETVRVYIRPIGAALLASPRRYLGEFNAGSLHIPLQADTAVFEFLGTDMREYRGGDISRTPDTVAIDSWIHSVAQFVQPTRRATDVLELTAGETRSIQAGSSLTTNNPLWLLADSPSLRLELPGTEELAAVRCLPASLDVSLLHIDGGNVRAVDSEQFMREFGLADIVESAQHIASALAAWDLFLRNASNTRALETAALNETALEVARKNIVAVTTVDKPITPVTEESLLAAVHIIAEHEQFRVVDSNADDKELHLEQRLGKIATASNFRYREVVLQGAWWQEHGPPILLQHVDGQQAAVALRQGSQYQLHDPNSGTVTPLDGEVAAQFSDRGYMLYPCLPNKITSKELWSFSLHGVGKDIRTLFIAGALSVLAGLIVPIATGEIISTALPDGRLNLLTHMALIIGAGAISMAMFTIVRSLASIRATSLIDLRLQPALWDRVLQLPSTFFNKFSSGDLAMRVLALTAMRRLIAGPALNGLLSGIFAIVSFILMLFYDLKLALLGFGFAAASGITFFILASRQLVIQRAILSTQGHVTSRVLDMLSGISKLRVAAAEERAFARWAERFSQQERAIWNSGQLRATQSTATVILPSIGLFGMLIVAGYRADPIDLAAFAAFNAAFGQFIAAIGVFSMSLGTMVEALPMLDRLQPIIEAEPEVNELRRSPGTLTGQLSIRGLSFRYHENGPNVLQDINITVEPGEFVAIVGPSGSGKSTLLRLLLGFEAPLSGAVFYDDEELAQLDLRLVRRQIGTVLQNASLIPGTLHDNIAGAALLSDQEVMEVAEQAGLADDIRKFPMGLETVVLEDASTLSGGQRQRTMIARALVGKPRILFFDEATSALDNHTQAVVAKSLNDLNVTRVIIAHRLSTIRDADKIIVIVDGRVAEVGKYDQLMQNQGDFYRLAKRQLLR